VQIPSLVRRVVPRGEFSRNVLTLVAGTGVAQIIIIASSPVLTRLYAPAEYGAFAVAMSIMSILLTLTSLRYEYAVPLPEADETAANIVVLALLVNVAMCAASFVVLAIAGAWIVALLNEAVLGPYVLLIALGQFGGGASATLTTWAVRTKTFSQIAATRLTQSTTLVVVQIGLGLLGAGPPALLVGDVAGRFSARVASRGRWRTHAADFRRARRQARRRRSPLQALPDPVEPIGAPERDRDPAAAARHGGSTATTGALRTRRTRVRHAPHPHRRSRQSRVPGRSGSERGRSRSWSDRCPAYESLTCPDGDRACDRARTARARPR
jgi:hypothetical protein